MHERSICRAIVARLVEAGAEQPGAVVSEAVIAVGPLAGVQPEELAAGFSLAAAGTIAAGARLVVHTAPLRWHCRDCGSDSESAVATAPCPGCGSDALTLLSGDGVVIERVELRR